MYLSLIELPFFDKYKENKDQIVTELGILFFNLELENKDIDNLPTDVNLDLNQINIGDIKKSIKGNKNGKCIC